MSLRSWWSGKRGGEDRAEDYTDRVIEAALSRISGPDGDTSAVAVAAVQASAGLVERAFTAAGGASLPPVIQGMIGRSLVERGEWLALIGVEPDGMVTLSPASTWDVQGSAMPSTWRYRMDLPAPSRVTTRRAPSDGVVHCRVNVDPAQPWRGRPGWRAARLTGSLAAEIEAGLRVEAKVPPARIATAPITNTGEEGKAELERYKKRLEKGGLVAVQSASTRDPLTAGGQEPANRWQPATVGPAPSPGLVSLRDQVFRDVVAACGIPPEMFTGGSVGARETWRRFVDGTLEGWGAAIEGELSEKLDRPVSFDWTKLRSADAVALMARAYTALVGAEIPPDEAKAIVGL